MHPELFRIPVVHISVPSFGVVLMCGFLLGTWWACRRCAKVKLDPDITLNLAFIILIVGTLSARVFYVVHYWHSEFAHQPAQVLNVRAGGMEVYGGIIGGFAACVIYLRLKHLSVRLFADVVTPSLLLAMGIGRIGCFLFGCCWGVPASETLPWAVRFPFGSPAHHQHWSDRLVTVPARLLFVSPDGLAGPMPRQILAMPDRRLADRLQRLHDEVARARAAGDAGATARAEERQRQITEALEPLTDHLAAFGVTLEGLRAEADGAAWRSLPLHPAQLYSAVGPVLLALLTSSYFYRRRRDGMVTVLGYSLYAVERFIEELLRTDNPQDTLGLTVSQAISLGVLVLGLVAWLVLRRLPARSPRAAAATTTP